MNKSAKIAFIILLAAAVITVASIAAIYIGKYLSVCNIVSDGVIVSDVTDDEKAWDDVRLVKSGCFICTNRLF